MKRLLFLVAAAVGVPVLFGAGTAPPGESASVKVEQAAPMLDSTAQILDLRPKADWDKGHLPYSKQLNLADENFTEKAKAMFDPSKPLLVYCRNGRCSPKAAKQLREAGFTKVDDLDGGIEAWESAGHAVER
jgi:rhodanese-related sulfurtransferase